MSGQNTASPVHRPHSQHKGNLQGVGAVGTGDAVLSAGEDSASWVFQLFDHRAADKLGGIQHLLDIGVNLRFEGTDTGLLRSINCIANFLFSNQSLLFCSTQISAAPERRD